MADQEQYKLLPGTNGHRPSAGDSLDLAAIRARAEAASPGVWDIHTHAHHVKGCRCLSCYQPVTISQPGGLFCDDIGQHDDPEDDGERCDQFGYRWPDALFISHAREDVLRLLAELAKPETERVAVISTPEPKHRCELPGHLPGFPSSDYDQHHEPVGTVIECEECGTRYVSRPWPDVRSGTQMVGNRWVRKVRPFCRRRRG